MGLVSCGLVRLEHQGVAHLIIIKHQDQVKYIHMVIPTDYLEIYVILKIFY